MMMVLILHLLASIDVLSLENHGSASYNVGWLLEIAAYCGVNCYALITGYVCCDGTFRYERGFPYGFRLFYTWGSLLLALLFFPQEVQLSNILHSLFPVLSGQYWYVTAYVGLFSSFRFLNALGNRLTKLQFQYLLVTVFDAVFRYSRPASHGCVPGGKEGYSIWWLGILYMLGMYVKKHGLLTK